MQQGSHQVQQQQQQQQPQLSPSSNQQILFTRASESDSAAQTGMSFGFVECPWKSRSIV
jgi:hypothetical protein